MSKTGTNPIESAKAIFMQYKTLAEKAMNQVADDTLLWKPDYESNSIYHIVKHLSGNMQSRWTDFLTSDGEKPWRNRDDEFEQTAPITRHDMMVFWEKGWTSLFKTLDELTPEMLGKHILIRGEAHSVLEAINRQIAHYSYHVGQIVYLCKMLQPLQWQTLSIARGKSDDFNNKLMK